MATIDLSQISITDANNRIRELGAAGESIEVLNPDARHHIGAGLTRSEEHTSELQSHHDLVCRLLLEKHI